MSKPALIRTKENPEIHVRERRDGAAAIYTIVQTPKLTVIDEEN